MSEFFCEPCASNTTVTSDGLHCLKRTNITCGPKDIERRLYIVNYVEFWQCPPIFNKM